LFDQIHFTQEEEEEMYLRDNEVDVMVQEEEGQQTKNDVPDGMKVLTVEKFASIKSGLDVRKICTSKQLAEFRKLLNEMIYQKKKRGVGNYFFCHVGSCKLSRVTKQKTRDHIEAKHVNRVQHLCEECHTPHKTSPQPDPATTQELSIKPERHCL